MTLVQFVSTYLNLNFLVVISFLGLTLLSILLSKLNFQFKSGAELSLNYLVVGLLLFFTILHPFLPANEIFKPAAKVWSAHSFKSFSQDFSQANRGGFMSLPTLSGTSSFSADRVALAWTIIFTILFICGGFTMLRSLIKLSRVRHKSFLIRNIGSTHIYINDSIQVPFSYWLPRQNNVVLPSALISRNEDYKMAVAHELQHHRNGDTKWVYVLWGLRLICIANPFIHLWDRKISEIQEFACDETLVDRNKVESQAYARCLVEVAQTAVHQKNDFVCATGLTLLVDRNILKRRIEKMFNRTTTLKPGRWVGATFGLAIASLMAVSAFAMKSVVQDRRVSMDQALVMAKKAQSKTDFPVAVNDLVLAQLNRYIGTPEGREMMRASLQRMENYRSVIESKIHDYGTPVELMAIPIIESGYQNLPDKNKVGWGAGLWMFISSTARAYGLQVDDQVDERLNVTVLTDAAMRYLQSNYLRFKDWQLAILAYNVGEESLQKAIDKTGSKDAWTLIRQGNENDRDYLARVMAAILIMKNPDSVK